MAEGPGNRNRRKNVGEATAVAEEKERWHEALAFSVLSYTGGVGRGMR
jgi:hypothetical protein